MGQSKNTYSIIPTLIAITARARSDLQLGSVGIGAARNFETHVVKDANLATRKLPVLPGGTLAILDCNVSAVTVRRRRQTLG